MEELDLKELFLIFWNRRLEILLITIIALIVGILYSYFYLTPVYKASTTLILAQSSKTVDKTGDSSITQTDLTLNSKLVSTYSEIMKRKSVLNKVISNLGMSEKDMDSIKKNVSVKAVSDTELIEITVKNEDPEKAALIANEIAKVFSEKVVEIYNISNTDELSQLRFDLLDNNRWYQKGSYEYKASQAEILVKRFKPFDLINFEYELTQNNL